jgi:RNA-directed DNA polymerase
MNLKISQIQSWDEINWSLVEHTVKVMRNQIFLAKRQENPTKLRKLQLKMLKSKSNLLFSIRRVTSVNQGKKTPGVDKVIYLTPNDRFKLYKTLSTIKLEEWKPEPIRRVYIPKPNGKQRPLGITTISDRVLQCVFKNALEPEWEAMFEHSSYGFRPGRSCQDAMIRTYKTLSKKKRTWILEGDIEGSFDNINHKALLQRLGNFPYIQIIERWLKAGCMKGTLLTKTHKGTPQGGIISPLLSNIALHGLEKALQINYHKNGYVRSECRHVLVRYADDFIVLNRSENDAILAKGIITHKLSKMGLVLSKEKTQITEAREGFDFLGFQFRLFEDKRKPSDEVTLVQPSSSSIIELRSKLRSVWRKSVGNKLELLIRPLNTQIVGICNYYKFANSNKFFRQMDNYNYLQAVRFIRRTHPNKSWQWLKSTYFKEKNSDKWTFYDRNSGIDLLKFRNWKIEIYIPVRYGAAPDDPQWENYFIERKLAQFKSRYRTRKSLIKMMKWQAFICPVCCELIIPEEDEIESLHVHNLIPKHKGGKDTYDNLLVCHAECHRRAHKKRWSKAYLINALTKSIRTNYNENRIKEKDYFYVKKALKL